ncbi:unnamed protein product [Linum tenue]|uniref:DDE Tnp4 domain-containing protein n=1 Tax=Linum tenue TaxID=586396 RepID=A0AAV0NWG6_9ROSI|nr:unnamed protein product [Linum tenue]
MKDLRDHEATCRATLRMGIDAFDIFCQKLRLTGVLKDYNRATDCIGAVGGSHFRVKVHRDDQTRFRGCKEWPTQNVLATCNFDLQFTYVLAGWEGTASDSRIIKNAFARPHGLVIPEGKYYLGDGGLMLRGSLLTPYRHVRYHLKESSLDGTKNAKELFNHRHASLRKSIDRAFGVVTKRFPIISTGSEPQYSFDTTTDIILPCCIIHNFLMGVDPDEALIAEVDKELAAQSGHNDTQCEEESRAGIELRDNIAEQMWLDYEK